MSFILKNKRCTIIGAARSGIAAANTIVRLGGYAKISEFKSKDKIEAELRGLENPAAVKLEYGGHTQAFIEDSDLIILSPGVGSGIAPVLWAKAAGIEVIGEIEFAFRLCQAPIIAVTGSNGKTTTVTVIAEILKRAGRSVILCGNIGSPFSKHVLSLTPQDIVVLEISSFQLETTVHFKPQVAVWLNFYQNHLDRHKDIDEYFQAKKRIFANQGPDEVAVINHKQDEFKNFSKELKSQVIFFNGPQAPKDIENPNFLAALAAVRVFGISDDISRDVLASFKGVEHRLEFVRSLKEVDYINDSKSTTPKAGEWALTHLQKPLVMICGGSDKHLDFSFLIHLVKAKVKHMIVFGQTKDILNETFQGVVPIDICVSLKDAVDTAQQRAKAGDAIVLSPMCASFDMFNDYEHRGRCFKDIVMELK